MAIPQTQIVAWLETPRPDARLEIRHDLPVPEPTADEVLIKMEYTGFCHSDVHNIHGELLMTTNVAGHEGVGRVVKVGSGVSSDMLGQRVGVKWIQSTCQKCDICKVQYTNCPYQNNSGRNVPGTFQQYVASPANFVTPVPETLKPEAVAPLLCAGLTMYSALKKLDKYCQKGDYVAIVGAGGGLGHLGVQIGKELGYRVIAVDSGKKKEICMKSGASGFVDFSTESPEEEVKKIADGLGAHAVIVVVGIESGYNLGAKLLRPLGTLICVGIPRLDFHVPLSPFACIDKAYTITGSAVGTEAEMQELLKLAAEGKVSTHYEVFNFEQINEVMDKLARYEIQGRAVLRLP